MQHDTKNNINNGYSAQWLSILAYVFIQQKKYDKAITLLEVLNLLQPHHPETTKMLAVAHLYKGNYKKTLLNIDQLIDNNTLDESTNHTLIFLKARALKGLNEHELADKAINGINTDYSNDITNRPSTWRNQNEK